MLHPQRPISPTQLLVCLFCCRSGQIKSFDTLSIVLSFQAVDDPTVRVYSYTYCESLVPYVCVVTIGSVMFVSFDRIGCVSTVSELGRHRGYNTAVTKNKYYNITDVTAQIMYSDLM